MINAINQLFGSVESPEKFVWAYDKDSNGMLTIMRADGEELQFATVATASVKRVSMIGTEVVSEADRLQADRVQVSDHGANRVSFQLFRDDVLVADLIFGRN
jgi:outer membrane lipoprotein-sorting protein